MTFSAIFVYKSSQNPAKIEPKSSQNVKKCTFFDFFLIFFEKCLQICKHFCKFAM